MIFSLLLMFCGLPYLSSNQSSVMNLSEMSSVHYTMKIGKDPVIEIDSKESSDPSLTMVNMDGQKYRCSIPQIPDSVTDDEKTVDDTEPDIAKLLSPLESAPCLFLTKEWWTYEVCYKRDIKQYHVEGDVPVGGVILLGTHNPAQDSWKVSNKTYHPQWYGNGSRCDLTGQLRQTEVRFVCNEAASQEFIGDILEHQSCEYRVVVHTTKLCGVQGLRTVAGTTPLPIVCQPLLSQLQMDKFKLFKEKSKLAQQLQQQQRRQEQSLQLVKQMEPRDRVKGVAAGFGTVDSMMEVMGDTMMEKIFGEVNTLLETTLSTFAGGEVNGEDAEQMSATSSNSVKDQNLKDRWDLIGTDQIVSLASLQDLIGKRNILWDRIFEARKTLEQFKAELIATERKLFTMKQTEENKDRVASLEMQWRSLEVSVRSIHVNISKLESQAKNVTRRILSMKNKLKEIRSAGVRSNHDEDKKDLRKVHKKSRNTLQMKDLSQVYEKISEDPNMPPLVDKLTESTAEMSDQEFETTTEVSMSSADSEDTVTEGSIEGLGGNIKISITKLSTNEDSEDGFDKVQAEKMVAKLEGMVRNKLSRNGLAISGKAVEVKLITTRLPEGMEDAEYLQVQSMFYNMMTGNVEGYEDIDQVRRDKENYGFSWRENMLEEIEEKIEKLSKSGADSDLVDKMLNYAIQQDEDVKNFWDKTKVIKASFPLDDGVKEVADKIVNDLVEEGYEESKDELSVQEVMDMIVSDLVEEGYEEAKDESSVQEVMDMIVNDIVKEGYVESKDESSVQEISDKIVDSIVQVGYKEFKDESSVKEVMDKIINNIIKEEYEESYDESSVKEVSDKIVNSIVIERYEESSKDKFRVKEGSADKIVNDDIVKEGYDESKDESSEKEISYMIVIDRDGNEQFKEESSEKTEL